MKRRFVLFFFLFFCIENYINGDEKMEARSLRISRLDFRGKVSFGVLNGKAMENVYSAYDRRRKISELIWDLRDVPIVSLHLESFIRENFSLHIDYKTNLGGGSGHMTDRDYLWYEDPSYWTHFSQSVVDIRDLVQCDMNGSYSFYSMWDETVKCRFFAGFKYIYWKWEDHIQYLIYSSDPDSGSLRDIFSSLDGLRGINYEQTYQMPYFGLALDFHLGKALFNVYASYSCWVRAKDRDFHILRELTFEEAAENGKYYSCGATCSYPFKESYFLEVGIHYEKVAEMRSDTSISDGYTKLVIPNSAGLGYHSSLANISFVKRF